MKILIDRSFERDVKKLPILIQLKVKSTIELIVAASRLEELGVTKMEGAKNAYRIRITTELGSIWKIIRSFCRVL